MFRVFFVSHSLLPVYTVVHCSHADPTVLDSRAPFTVRYIYHCILIPLSIIHLGVLRL
jgi:hypothetical protein